MAEIINDKGLEDLKQAIIIQACNDLFTCERKIRAGKNTANRIGDCRALKAECLDFFYSEQFKMYADYSEALTGDVMVKKIYEVVDDVDRYPSDYGAFPLKRYDKSEEDK
jgi:hypothetical protein